MFQLPDQIVYKLSPARDRFMPLNDADVSRIISFKENLNSKNISVCKEVQCFDSHMEINRHISTVSEFQCKVRNLSRMLSTDKKAILLTAYTILDELQDIQMPLGQCAELFARLRKELIAINDILQGSNLTPSKGLIEQMTELQQLIDDNEKNMD